MKYIFSCTRNSILVRIVLASWFGSLPGAPVIGALQEKNAQIHDVDFWEVHRGVQVEISRFASPSRGTQVKLSKLSCPGLRVEVDVSK
jgi:hypothetical protein